MRYQVAVEQIETKFLRIRNLELNQKQYKNMKSMMGKEIKGFKLIRITPVVD